MRCGRLFSSELGHPQSQPVVCVCGCGLQYIQPSVRADLVSPQPVHSNVRAVLAMTASAALIYTNSALNTANGKML